MQKTINFYPNIKTYFFYHLLQTRYNFCKNLGIYKIRSYVDEKEYSKTEE